MTGINASHQALQIALGMSAHKITRVTNYLIEKSLLIFKKYKNSFALYEGSDFDIEDELSKALKQAPQISVSKIATDFLPKKLLLQETLFTNRNSAMGRNGSLHS